MKIIEIETVLGKFKMHRADTFLRRLKGLLFTQNLPQSDCLLITPCTSIHTLGMRYPINIIFLDKSNVILNFENQVLPNRVCLAPSKTVKVIEFSAETRSILPNVIGLKFMEGEL